MVCIANGKNKDNCANLYTQLSVIYCSFTDLFPLQIVQYLVCYLLSFLKRNMTYNCLQRKAARTLSAFWQSVASVPHTCSTTQSISRHKQVVSLSHNAWRALYSVVQSTWQLCLSVPSLSCTLYVIHTLFLKKQFMF